MSRVALVDGILRRASDQDTHAYFAAGLAVHVYKRGTTEHAELFDAESGGAAVAQPLTTDQGGRPRGKGGVLVWVEPGSYDIVVAGQRLPWDAGSAGGGEGGEVSKAELEAEEEARKIADEERPTTALFSEEFERLEGELAGKQPLDSDLTAIAALSTQSVGRDLLKQASFAALRTYLEVLSASETKALIDRSEHGFAVVGAVETRTYRGFYASVASGELKKLVGAKFSLAEGTKAKFTIKQSGAAVTGFKELEAKPTAAEVSGKSVTIADGDRFDLVVELTEGDPQDLIVTLFFERTHI